MIPDIPTRRPPAVAQRSTALVDDDGMLVQRALAGERWAEDALYRRHAPAVTRVCSRLLGRRSDADDVVQDTFVTAFSQLSKLREPSAARAWLMRIAVHRARRKLRARNMFALFGLGSGEGEQAALTLAHEHTRPDLRLELAVVERALAQEPATQRTSWLLHRVEQLSIQETAEATSRSIASVKRDVAAVDARIARAHGGLDEAGR